MSRTGFKRVNTRMQVTSIKPNDKVFLLSHFSSFFIFVLLLTFVLITIFQFPLYFLLFLIFYLIFTPYYPTVPLLLHQRLFISYNLCRSFSSCSTSFPFCSYSSIYQALNSYQSIHTSMGQVNSLIKGTTD